MMPTCGLWRIGLTVAASAIKGRPSGRPACFRSGKLQNCEGITTAVLVIDRCPAAYQVNLRARPPARGRDAVPFDLDRWAARPDGLAHRHCEPGEHKLRQHLAPESTSEHDRFGRVVLPSVSEYFEGAALFATETRFSRGCRHSYPLLIEHLDVEAETRPLSPQGEVL
jgi:hypothetical protein